MRNLRWAVLVLAARLCPGADTAPTAAIGGNLPVQRIGQHDLVSVSVYGAPEFSRTVRVSAEGSVRLPMMKRAVRAEGLYPEQLELALGDGLRAEGILVDPAVTVNIVEYFSRPINVAGAVKRPLTFQALGATTLLDAITKAEGLTQDAGPEILVSRKQPGPDGKPMSLVQRIPVRGLIDAADPDLNLRLFGGEEVRVPEVGKVFVMGNVRKPGAYAVRDVGDTTVMKILAHSEGLMPFASKHAFIYRKEASGAKNEIPIELKAILDRKAQDVPLMADDILYVPDNRSKRLSITALERMLTFGSATISGFLILR